MQDRLAGFAVVLGAVLIAAVPCRALDLSGAVIVPLPAEGVVSKAAEMLQEELAARSGLTLSIATEAPETGSAILLGTAQTLPGVNVPEKPEAYGIAVDGNRVRLAGRDERGALFAAGRLIRLANAGPGTLSLELAAPIATAPDAAYRAHQLGYRHTANTYDAWTIETYEQYIRDLILFGSNGIELITNLDPQAKDGPVMAEPMRAMNVKLSALTQAYGIDLWLWSPVMAEPGEDVTTPEGKAIALEKRRQLFKDYPSITHVFVPGGDDGNTPAKDLMPFLEELAPILHEYHPSAKIWVSNQTFTLEENDYFFDYLRKEDPQWLHGLVYGPWVKMAWEEMRERTPKRFPIRSYPDITHTLRCQYPVPNWDPAFANSVGREPIMPMPEMQRHIYLRYRDVSDGFGSYSDGVHDDLNKMLWSAYGWDPETDLDAFLAEYGNVFFGGTLATEVAQGLRMLERNWHGPILENQGIPATRDHWERIAARVSGFDTHWRAQMYLFRARFDANVQAETRAQRGYEQEAHAALAQARTRGVNAAIEQARAALAQADTPAEPELRSSIEALGPLMLKSIGYQLSVEPPYLARNPERGAMLDWLDQPLNDRPWLEQRFETIQVLDSEAAQLEAIDQILNWTDPGPGGFYDNLGAVGEFSHVVYQRSWEDDPSACRTPRVAFMNYKADQAAIQDATSQVEADNMVFKEEAARLAGAFRGRQELRMSWQSQMSTLYGTPLKLRYEGLDPEAQYNLRVTYVGRFKPTMLLTLNDEYCVHGPVPQPEPVWPVEYYLPRDQTRSGTLEIEWNLVEGRGCMVAEVWLIKAGGE